MRRIICAVFLFLIGLASQNPAHSQTYCTLAEFYDTCVGCDGILITGQAYYDFIGECYPCVTRCPDDLLPESIGDGWAGGAVKQPPSCGLTWSQFADQAKAAEKAGGVAEVRYVQVDLGREFLNLLAARAPLMVNFFVVRDGHIRLDSSDVSLPSAKEEPAMISSFVASSEMANWLIDRRSSILTESGRNNLEPPPRNRLPDNERQVLYTNVERLGEGQMIATLRATRFSIADRESGPSVLEEQVLVLELTAGQAQGIPDTVRPILGDNQPGLRLRAEIDDYSLSTHSSSDPTR